MSAQGLVTRQPTGKPPWPIAIDANGCHVWQGALLRAGYGTITIEGRTRLAHRYIYEAERGPIPDGLHIDHLCRNRACVNPDHLEPVTQAENNRRAADAQATCVNGHPRTAENLLIDGQGLRRCKVCRAADRREAQRRYKARNRAKVAAAQREYRARKRSEVAS